jgi:hypothetical protein
MARGDARRGAAAAGRHFFRVRLAGWPPGNAGHNVGDRASGIVLPLTNLWKARKASHLRHNSLLAVWLQGR